MLASDVARHIVAHYGDAWFLTNLKLNLLVYWCQVGALRDAGAPLFADEIAVGECGPVIPAIWAEYEAFGSRMIRLRDEWQGEALGENTESLVASVMRELGWLTAADLLNLSSQPDGAWNAAREQGNENISMAYIAGSADMRREVGERTLAACVDGVECEYPNALRLLEHS
ncbi:Panacea domain-containing protein [Bifidobacterium animalis]|uniref:Panacea domain-containing protein n=1 Tax=Bifidobacterium animalis TaxID=28025 RepID=UPI0006995F9F|nr:type II toxin-antitoxin system antitoxin SocA domain-containing protein [Bifidobacterium animalis]KOA53910.1 hypothetical protein BAAA27672_07940 [Bifidobacterium animalis subsp. animalis ATCC 27672]